MPTAQHLRAQIEARIPFRALSYSRVSLTLLCQQGFVRSIHFAWRIAGRRHQRDCWTGMFRTHLSCAHICSRYDPGRQGVRLDRRFRHLASGICGGHWSGPFAVALDTLRPALQCCALAEDGRKTTQAKTGIAPGGWQSSADGSQRSFRGSQRSAGCSSSLRGSTAQPAASI